MFFTCDPNGLAHCTVPVHGSEASRAKDVSENAIFFLDVVLTMSIGSHHFLPEDA